MRSTRRRRTTTQASAYSNPQGLPPASVVFFPGDGTLLSADGRAHVRAAVEEFKQRGGTGYVRVVGHSSSRTSNMPVEKHLEVIFNKSQDRANAVAKELIAEGVPANRVLVEAVGDSQPFYYESMPKGEDGNDGRRYSCRVDSPGCHPGQVLRQQRACRDHRDACSLGPALASLGRDDRVLRWIKPGSS